MKKTGWCVLPALMLFFISGCLKLDQTLTIRPDASGSLELKYSITEQAIEQLRAMRQLKEQMAALTGQQDLMNRDDYYAYLLLDPDEEALRKELAGYGAYGIQIDSLVVRSRNARREVEIKASFADLKDAARADFFKQYGFQLRKYGQNNYLLQRKADSSQQDQLIQDDSFLAQTLHPLMGGLSLVFRVNTPGAILETDATRRSRNRAEWVFDFDSDPRVLSALQNRNMTVIFDGHNIDLPEIGVN